MARQSVQRARYVRTAKLLHVYGDQERVAKELGITKAQVQQDLFWARRNGLAAPKPGQNADRWASETARISDLTVGSRSDLLCSLGADLVKRIATECPVGVPLMVYIAGIVKDNYDDESV